MTGRWVRGGERPAPQAGVILQLRAYELHGTPYYAVQFRLDSDPEGGSREARLSADMIYPEPQPGDRVLVQSVVGVVDRMEKA
ncbi:MAG: hypothetical protein M3P30_01060 [Chloroflexota bacterium]|nr:hypothetical protein [Chloroflexota bacterium]